MHPLDRRLSGHCTLGRAESQFHHYLINTSTELLQICLERSNAILSSLSKAYHGAVTGSVTRIWRLDVHLCPDVRQSMWEAVDAFNLLSYTGQWYTIPFRETWIPRRRISIEVSVSLLFSTTDAGLVASTCILLTAPVTVNAPNPSRCPEAALSELVTLPQTLLHNFHVWLINFACYLLPLQCVWILFQQQLKYADKRIGMSSLHSRSLTDASRFLRTVTVRTLETLFARGDWCMSVPVTA